MFSILFFKEKDLDGKKKIKIHCEGYGIVPSYSNCIKKSTGTGIQSESKPWPMLVGTTRNQFKLNKPEISEKKPQVYLSISWYNHGLTSNTLLLPIIITETGPDPSPA